MSEHTPGPWHTKRCKSDGLFQGTLYIEGQTREDDTIAILGVGKVHYANAEANARLIVAAPELLMVCQSTLASLKQWAEEPTLHDFDAAFIQLSLVIAKAKGEVS